ncbi:MAG: hypothetical protein R3D84_06940 [Paracoccaceae bacterium]
MSNSTGFTKAKAIYSGIVTIADDAVGTINTPGTGGFVLIGAVNATFARGDHSGIFFYDSGSSLRNTSLVLASNMANLDATVLTGTTGTDGRTSVSVQTGQIQIENRLGSAYEYTYTFLGSF